MEHNCERHPFDLAEGMCRSCLGSFCTDCLIYPFGPDQQPFCKPCAIAAAGIRSTAGNPRRNVAPPEKVAKVKTSTGGFLGRWRRGGGPTEEEIEHDEEELLEIEAADARSLLDAQRLPSQTDEESEPEPPPTPNIAPPAGFDDERELTHRAMPDEVAGGLDLGSVSEPETGTAAAPEPASPTFEHAEPEPADPNPLPDQLTGTDTGDPLPSPPRATLDQVERGFGSDQAPAPGDADLPPPPSPPSPPADVRDEPTTPANPLETVNPDPSEDELPTDPRHAEPVAAEAGLRTSAPAPPARTADGVDLFAAAPVTRFQDLLKPVNGDDGDPAPSSEPDLAPTPVAVGAATDGIGSVTAAAQAAADTADGSDDVRELLRRIADLRAP